MATYTKPTGLFSLADGPALPVIPTPISEPLKILTFFARYIEFDGHLHIRRDIDVIDIAKYDFSTTVIEKCSKRFIRAKIKTSNFEKNDYVEIVLINEDNGWRIDSATY